MPLLIDGEHVSQPGHSSLGLDQKGSLSRIVSGMKVSCLDEDSAGLSHVMRDVSALFNQDQVKLFGVQDSTL